MTEGATIPVSAASDTIAARLAAHDGVLVGLDFDGTLAPIAASPATPTITPHNRRAVATLLACPGVRVAVVSGRELADLRPRVGLDGVVYAGNHGLELADGTGRRVHPEASARRPTLERAIDALTATLADVPGWKIEDKQLTATLHYRHVPAVERPAVDAAIDRLGTALDGISLVEGKESVELRPALDWDKGAALATLASRQPPSWLTMYIGDDTTDEDAFRVLDAPDVSVFVGDGETAAAYRLPSQRQVAPFLEWVGTRVRGATVGGDVRTLTDG